MTKTLIGVVVRLPLGGQFSQSWSSVFQGGSDDFKEFVGIETCPTYESAIDVRLSEEGAGI